MKRLLLILAPLGALTLAGCSFAGQGYVDLTPTPTPVQTGGAGILPTLTPATSSPSPTATPGAKAPSLVPQAAPPLLDSADCAVAIHLMQYDYSLDSPLPGEMQSTLNQELAAVQIFQGLCASPPVMPQSDAPILFIAQVLIPTHVDSSGQPLHNSGDVPVQCIQISDPVVRAYACPNGAIWVANWNVMWGGAYQHLIALYDQATGTNAIGQGGGGYTGG